MVQISLGQKFLPAVCNMHDPGKFAIIKNNETPLTCGLLNENAS